MKLFRRILQLVLLFYAFPAFLKAQNIPARDPWVFRSVLDNIPRALTIAMHPDLWISYNTETCELAKIWKGGVSFRGEVYTSEKIYQPTLSGVAFYTKSGYESDWIIFYNNKYLKGQSKFVSYKLYQNRVLLKFKILNDAISPIILEEEPIFYTSPTSLTGIKRIFRVIENKSDAKISIRFNFVKMPNINGFEANTACLITEKTEHIISKNKSEYSLNGIAEIKNTGDTFIINYINEK